MGQQLPYLPNGQNPFGQNLPAAPPTLPAAQLPPMPGMPQTVGQPGVAAMPGAIPGVDPRMMQQAQQSLANPNGGDVNAIGGPGGPGGPGSLLPGPKELGEGALIGGAVTLGFAGLEKIKAFDKMAHGIDYIPGIKQLSSALDARIIKLKNNTNRPFLREFTVADAILTPADIAGIKDEKKLKKIYEDTAKKAVDNMEKRQLESTMGRFSKRLKKQGEKNKSLQKAYEKMLDDMKGFGGPHTPHNFLDEKMPKGIQRIGGSTEYDAALKSFNESMKSLLKETGKRSDIKDLGNLSIAAKSDAHRTLYNFLNPTYVAEYNAELKSKALKEWENTVGKHSAHDAGVLNELNRQFRYLDGKKRLTKEESILRRELYHIKERVSGINKIYTPLFESQAKQTAQLSAEGVGPVGRTFRSFANYLQRIFRGDTMGMGSKAATAGEGFFAKLTHYVRPAVMPMFLGATIFGFSFQSAKNAQPGEKKQAFFHNLLGSQIFNFIGWEFGRKLLNASHFGDKVFRGLAGKTLPGILQKLPVLGGITLGGLGTELVAMFIFGGLFQKVGEKLSHAIFGKPSQASIDGKPAAPGAQKPGQQAPNPALSGQPPSGAYNPALMNQGVPQAGLPAGQPPIPGQAPNPTAYPAQNPMANPMASSANPSGTAGMNGNPATMARTPQAGPQFSLTPQQISYSPVEQSHAALLRALQADNTLTQSTGDILNALNNPSSNKRRTG
jgi:hypothetical protein